MNITERKGYLNKNPKIKNFIWAFVVAVFGFLLLNLTFLFNFLVFQFFGLFVKGSEDSLPHWFPLVRHFIFLLIIGVISWGVFRSRLWLVVKATYLTVPVAVTLVTIGMLLYTWPILPYVIGGLITVGILAYLFKTKQPWIYYYSVVLVALALLIFTLLGGEI